MDKESVGKGNQENKDNVLGAGWYIAILVLVVLFMHIFILLLGSLMSALDEAYTISAVSLLAGVIVCCTVYLGSVLLRTGRR